MNRMWIAVLILCAAVSQAAGAGAVKSFLTEQPEFVITEEPFLSFEDMEPGEERSQVFSIWNTGEEEEAYYFIIQASEDLTWELEKAGDEFLSGQALETPAELVKLSSGEHMVFQLTVKNTGNIQGKAVPVFAKKKILSCGKK